MWIIRIQLDDELVLCKQLQSLHKIPSQKIGDFAILVNKFWYNILSSLWYQRQQYLIMI